MKPLVSVIVPVYKVEEYLPRCLNSLQRQSLTNIEILLINDASPDRCGEICERYAAKDSRFKVIYHTKNKGLAAARNTGIGLATANYLMFVDSDDWVHEDFCKLPYECALNNDVDMVMFRRQRVGSSESFKNKNCSNSSCSKDSGYITHLEATDLLFNYFIVGEYSWNKLYRKELFQTISFPEGYLYEDVGTIYKTVWQSSKIFFLDAVLYYYYYRDNSIITLKTEKKLHDMIEMSMQQYNDLKAWGYPERKLNCFYLNRALGYCMSKKPAVSDKYYTFCAHILLNSEIPTTFAWKRVVLVFLFRYFNPLFEWACARFGKKYC